MCVSVYGVPEKILTDNGGEFPNAKFITAEAPWSYGLRERHNLVFADMLNKVLDGTQCHPDLAVSWLLMLKTHFIVCMDFPHTS